jgi:hypothetical protein
MPNLGPEYDSHPVDAALVEQGRHAALRDTPGKICASCAVALRTAYLASSRTPPAFLLTKALDHFRRMQIRCIRSAG